MGSPILHCPSHWGSPTWAGGSRRVLMTTESGIPSDSRLRVLCFARLCRIYPDKLPWDHLHHPLGTLSGSNPHPSHEWTLPSSLNLFFKNGMFAIMGMVFHGFSGDLDTSTQQVWGSVRRSQRATPGPLKTSSSSTTCAVSLFRCFNHSHFSMEIYFFLGTQLKVITLTPCDGGHTLLYFL